jgi:predicted  nucleic acid-binding Zn-ribbon protein
VASTAAPLTNAQPPKLPYLARRLNSHSSADESDEETYANSPATVRRSGLRVKSGVFRTESQDDRPANGDVLDHPDVQDILEENKKLKMQLHNLQQRVGETLKDEAAFQARKDRLRGEMEALEAQKHALKQQIMLMEEKKEEMIDGYMVSMADADKKVGGGKSSKYRKAMQSLQDENKELSKQVQILSKQRKDLQQRVHQLESQIKTLGSHPAGGGSHSGSSPRLLRSLFGGGGGSTAGSSSSGSALASNGHLSIPGDGRTRTTSGSADLSAVLSDSKSMSEDENDPDTLLMKMQATAAEHRAALDKKDRELSNLRRRLEEQNPVIEQLKEEKARLTHRINQLSSELAAMSPSTLLAVQELDLGEPIGTVAWSLCCVFAR